MLERNKRNLNFIHDELCTAILPYFNCDNSPKKHPSIHHTFPLLACFLVLSRANVWDWEEGRRSNFCLIKFMNLSGDRLVYLSFSTYISK